MGRVLVKIELWILGLYKSVVSPLMGQHCRYEPTCSVYAMQALEKHGLLKGNLKTLWRLLRCAPWGRGGFDPA